MHAMKFVNYARDLDEITPWGFVDARLRTPPYRLLSLRVLPQKLVCSSSAFPYLHILLSSTASSGYCLVKINSFY